MSRRIRHLEVLVGVAAMVSLFVAGAHADVVIDTVSVGNPGNTGEGSGEGYGGWGPNRVCGAVPYFYNIGKHEVTAGQYAAFLNAVAATDTYALYNPSMWSDAYSCKIRRTGEPGSYTYLVDADEDGVEDLAWVNRPVTFVSWGDAARFANWLHNGKPTGPQGLMTTEDGSYYLNGATTDAELLAVLREPTATWVIPSEDEWYKAAYHMNDGVTGNYWDYPTGTNDVPNNGNPEGDTGNSANFWDGDYTIGPEYWRTDVGFFSLSESPYGTFDQGGNVWEWNEGILYDSSRGLRGGGFGDVGNGLLAHDRNHGHYPAREEFDVGFRIAIPEPATTGLLLVVGIGVLRRQRI